MSHESFFLFHHGVLIWLECFSWWYIAVVRWPPCELNSSCSSTTAESGAKVWCRWGAFGPPQWLGLLSVLRRGSVVVDFLFIVTPIVGVCGCSMYYCVLLYVHSSIAIILMGKRGLVALLDLSSWCLVVLGRLFLAVVCSLWLWYFLIILTYYFQSTSGTAA